jgi:site-specific DNA-methyltransferase (adenine-specific)
MKKTVRDAFINVRRGHSADVVIADPERNKRFLDACRRLGRRESAYVLNMCLLNLRKAGDLQDLPRSRRVTIKGQSEFRFASEIAVRYLERKYGVTLDQVLCDPVKAKEFDETAAKLAPGYRPFDYRWAALNLRKMRQLKPELILRVVPAQEVITCRISELDVMDVPSQQGVYLFYDGSNVLYVGEANNLRKRIGKHLEHSDNKGLARWLWAHGSGDLHLEYHVLGPDVSTKIRKALEGHLILSRRPIFNVAGTEE